MIKSICLSQKMPNTENKSGLVTFSELAFKFSTTSCRTTRGMIAALVPIYMISVCPSVHQYQHMGKFVSCLHECAFFWSKNIPPYMGFWRGTALEPCGRPAIVSVQEKPKMTKTHVTVWLDQKEELSKAGHCGWAPATAGVSAIASRSAKDAAKAALIPWWQEILAHENIYWNFFRGSNPCLETGPNSFNMWAKSFYLWLQIVGSSHLEPSWPILNPGCSILTWIGPRIDL